MDKIIEEFPKRIREKLGIHVKRIILFGSRARGNFNPKTSDYDFLIVVDKNDKNIREDIFNTVIETEMKYDELITNIIWSNSEMLEYKNYPIGINIFKEGKEL